MHIAFTGTRKLTPTQKDIVWQDLVRLSRYPEQWHVGDAQGVDEMVRTIATRYAKQITVYEVEGKQRWHFAERSKRMIEGIADLKDPWLYAYPNKPCPSGCKPCKNPNGGGSGTWLTIAYAVHKGLKVKINPLVAELELPNWLHQPQQPQQLTLW